MTKKIGFVALFAIILTLALSGCNRANLPPEVTENEILLQIQLDVKEDIGLLIVNYDSEGFSGSGGTSNANRSLLKRGELINYPLDKENYGALPDEIKLSLQFIIITDYFEPNYDNIYPAEYTMPLKAISLDARFGESYSITITGDRTNGYTAVAVG